MNWINSILNNGSNRPTRRSLLGVLLGKNRRRGESAPRMVQGELALKSVRPVRNDLRDDDVALVERRASRVIWETPVAATASDDQDLAWNRLRGRRERTVAPD